MYSAIKIRKHFITGLFFLFVVFSSCTKSGTGNVSFGANYDLINCITTVKVYVDGEMKGKLENPSHTITDCNQPQNLNLVLPTGIHHYRVEIRPLEGTGCSKDIEGSFRLNENDCKKIFIDYTKIEWNK
jgi:hypothetical protein